MCCYNFISFLFWLRLFPLDIRCSAEFQVYFTEWKICNRIENEPEAAEAAAAVDAAPASAAATFISMKIKMY